MHTLVIDTNIAFSAIIKPGKIREILFRAPLKLYAPQELQEELKELKPKMLKHTKLTIDEVNLIEKISYWNES